MASIKPPFTVKSGSFNPETLFTDEALNVAKAHLQRNDLKSAITTFFDLPPTDSYIYHATADVTLTQVQAAINAGSNHGLHDWYLGATGAPTLEHPPAPDIAAYISLFDPAKSAANSLKSLGANAKKDSLRASIARHLIEKRHLDPTLTIPKRKAPRTNPYYLFWSWSCHSLQYGGPDASTVNVKASHHVLPVFMHHFACVCPSYEALEIVCKVARGRSVLDIGSGSGYWTLMLRRHGCDVIPVDSQQSVYRTCWIGDTIKNDGVEFVTKTRDGAREDVLLLVYPVVSGEFTKNVIRSYEGDTICVAGTQNGNGYTGFKAVVVDEWMAREMGEAWKKVVQVPLPSFAGKDDALFVFKLRKE